MGVVTKRLFLVIFTFSLTFFFTFAWFFALPVEAGKSLSVMSSVSQLPSQSEACSVPGSESTVNCAYGYVIVDGEPVEAQVEVKSDQNSFA